MKLLNKTLILLSLIIFSLVQYSCEENDSGITFVGFEARFVTDINIRTVTFTNVSNEATSYMWDFGDETTSTLVNPDKTYDNGTYTVTLTATNANGETATFQDTIVIDVPVCVEENAENTDPANGPLNFTFLNQDAIFDAFGNTEGAIVSNPVLDDVNSSCNVQQFIKTTGCFTFAGLGIELPTAIDFSDPSTNKIFKMKVLAEDQLTDVALRLEFMPFPNTEPSQERVASITQIGEWQELTFDFSDVNTNTFQSIIIYFDKDATCDGDVYYFDDIVQE